MKTALVGSNGTIGSSILNSMTFNHVYNSDNIGEMKLHKFDLVVVAAPSGNRLAVNKDPDLDLRNIGAIMDVISHTQISRLVLISTVDTISYYNTAYGQHRLQLENFIAIHCNKYHILRPSTLIGRNIKKNVLFDLKNNLFIDKIDPATVVQWCPLDSIHNEINYVIKNDIVDLNLVSEPISNQDIIDEFFPATVTHSKPESKQYNVQPYRYTREEIYTAIRNYLC
jgi:hypothetical protein